MGIKNFKSYNELLNAGDRTDYFRAVTSALTNGYYELSKTYIRIRLLR